MIASLRGVVALLVVASALAVIAMFDVTREPPNEDRSLISGLEVARLDWTSLDGTFGILRKDATWVRTTSESVDATAVDAVLSTLRGARWHRRRPHTGEAGMKLQITRANGTTESLAVGVALEGTEQVWLVRGGDDVLVDGWVARALMPASWMLMTRRPFADIDGLALGLTVAGRTVSIDHHRDVEAREWIDPELIDALTHAVSELTFVGQSCASSVDSRITIQVARARLTGMGPCVGHPELVEIETTSGAGRVSATSWNAVEAAARALAQPREHVVDRRPLPVTAVTLAFGDGTLTLGKPTTVAIAGVTHAVDGDRTTELLVALGTPGEVVPMPAGKPARVIVAIGADPGEVNLELHAPDVVVRREDATALRIGSGAWDLLARPAARYRDRTLWREEPTTITTITIDGVTWHRGEVIGEWRTSDGPSTPRPSLETFVATVAGLRGLDADPPRGFAVVHQVTVVVSPPGASAPITHELELGAASAAGCPARAAGREVLAPAVACAVPR